ncbi:hypothetical protein [Arhodomonas sp. AD133]|uniref:AbiTii domain-containing protein n=1 Tax=Arhodomonas sp. AD133 TaxID=3415009 RepID=UPI003EBA3B41
MACVITSIRDEASHEDVELARVLQRTVLMATALRTKAVTAWLKSELNGYPPDARLPVYRRGQNATLIAWMPGQGWAAAPISPTLAKELGDYELRTGVEALERDEAKRNPREPPRIEFDDEHLRAMQQRIGLDARLSLALPPNAVAEVLDTVRQTIVAWSDALLEAGVQGDGSVFSDSERHTASEVAEHLDELISEAHETAQRLVAERQNRHGGFLSRLFGR